MSNQTPTDKKITFRDNSLLKKPGISFDFDKDQIEEFQKCAADPIYFIKNYIKIISLDEGIIKFNLYDYQENMVNTFHNNKFVICKLPRQSGKCEQYQSLTNIRNKITGEIKQIQIGEFFDSVKENS